jgi:hypothetical protein
MEKDKSEDGFVSVFSTPNPAEVAMIKSLLDSADIDYFVSNENLHTLYGSADGFTAVEFRVYKGQAEEARELLKEFIVP